MNITVLKTIAVILFFLDIFALGVLTGMLLTSLVIHL